MSARPILLLFKFRAIILILLAIGALNTGSLQAVEPDWSAYNALLRQNVRPGQISGIPLNRVNYAGIKANPGWSNVVAMIAAFPVSKLANRSEKLAFYINAYNILTIDLIIKGGIPASIRNLGESVWKQNNVRLDGRLTSLDAIEHQLLRPLGEPRIHFAIVCASISCPDLRAEAYTAKKLYPQLYAQTSRFLRNTAKGLLLVSSNSDQAQIRISQIFAWFAADFKPVGGVESFIQAYRPDLKGRQLQIQADLPYNWNLNR